jgi:hypothetical protein
MKSCVTYTLRQIASGWYLKADGMVGTCRIYEKEAKVMTKTYEVSV